MPKSEVFNLDCMKGMAAMPDKAFDLAIVDPPYQAHDAIGLINGNAHSANRTAYKLFENVKPTDEYFEQLKRVSREQIVWGGNFFGLVGGYLCWNKNGTAFGEGELAYCSMFNSIRFFEFTWNGMIQGYGNKQKEKRIHPTQKPVALYKWLLTNYAKDGDSILDSHLGSGSSRIAAYDLGFDFTGYELDKDYFEAQERRFADHIAQPKLFVPEQTEATQGSLLS
jgi:site-specific DNA-methyltransferase (adenine-specific)